MAYAISHDDSNPAKMLRRIAREELGKALEEVATQRGSVSIHSLRKKIKKTRGALRLVAPRFEGFKSENAALAEAAGGISGLRDAEVMRGLLARISTEAPKAASAAQAMLDTLPPRPHEVAPDTLFRFAEQVGAIRKRAKHWKVSGSGWKPYADGLGATLHDCRKRMKQARSSGDADDLHAWRSRIKHHWYHTRILMPIWPDMLGPRAALIDHLGELIGDDHDLTVLTRATIRTLPEDQAAPLLGAIRDRQQGLQAEALALGARLFAEKPDALTQRWGAWYALWRKD